MYGLSTKIKEHTQDTHEYIIIQLLSFLPANLAMIMIIIIMMINSITPTTMPIQQDNFREHFYSNKIICVIQIYTLLLHISG